MKSFHVLQSNYWHSDKSMLTAKYIVDRKMSTMNGLLNYYLNYRIKRYPDMGKIIVSDIKKILNVQNILSNDTESTRKKLFLNEAVATKYYWHSFGILIGSGGTWKRFYPKATDEINMLLNIAYTMLLNTVRVVISNFKLSVEIGFLHSPVSGEESLLYDLVELFRQPVVDSCLLPFFIRKNNNHNQQKIILAISKNLNKQYWYKGFNMKLKTIIQNELYEFERCLKNGKTFIPYKHSWSHRTK